MEKPEPSEGTLEGIQELIANYKKRHALLVEEQQELVADRNDLRDTTRQFRQRADKQAQLLTEERSSCEEQIAKEKAKLSLLRQEEIELMGEIQRVEAALEEEEATHGLLERQVDVFAALPEKEVVFRGETGKAADTRTFDMKPRIVYPMEGGTALVTFEEEDVAQRVLAMTKHRVDLEGKFRITVEARPVQLWMPKLVEIDSEVCPRRVLISNLPEMDTEAMLNKLEIHFSKRRHGGGEVDNCVMLPDSRTVVMTFVENNVAKGLRDTEYHDVQLQNKKHRVRVTPFLNGTLTDLRLEKSACRRTVLLTGIPPVAEDEILQDLLEIHFQKSSNGGGEIEAVLYNPLGQHTSVLFEGVSPDREK
ncbi:interferon-induced protein 35 [Xiphias gladius]|uniref:interferon-induced protein 35 n=1 Tax=Xiphias gladius TaxID=8245 RepID=UPI001A99718B|nr:interferon-induced protein 35 [Xiphias gladius]